MQWQPHWQKPWWLIPVLLQSHLYTGLFITAHDAMHGTVSGKSSINKLVGSICLALYAAFSFRQLKQAHHMHHSEVATEKDPDYYAASFWPWYLQFMWHYLRWWQLLIMAISFNVLHYVLHIPQPNLILFWVLPSLLSTLQLFYFGTYRPHHQPELLDNRHKSRSQHKNHLLAFISCYFFGYHFEHHDQPHLPWWRLWQSK